MNPTKNDIPADRRAPLTQLLNERLADLIDLQLQTKQAHWNVKGPNMTATEVLTRRAEQRINPPHRMSAASVAWP